VSIYSTGLGDSGGLAGVSKSRAAPTPIVTPHYATIPDWVTISGMRRTATYEGLGRGNLRAIKLNGRTLIDVPHGLAYLASLPAAQITTGRRRNRDTAAAAE
jgi:hypothetical protein